jgi:hypothetical protein
VNIHGDTQAGWLYTQLVHHVEGTLSFQKIKLKSCSLDHRLGPSMDCSGRNPPTEATTSSPSSDINTLHSSSRKPILKKQALETLSPNQEYATLIPPVSDADYQRLKASIKKERGLLVPITLNQDNIILDG